MARSTNKKGPGRWVVGVGSVVVTAGFLVAIVNGPQPDQANAAASSIAVQPQPADSGSSGMRGSSSRYNGAAPLSASPRPRLRSRGS
jgi:hypothetical protein